MEATLFGASDTSYKNGLFILKIKFPDNYPHTAPEIVFLTPIYHLNVNFRKINMPGAEELGHVNVSFLNWWRPETTVREMLTKLITVFYMPNSDSCYSIERANEFRNNRCLYEAKVKYFTKKYANFINASKIYDNWDFSVNENELQ